MLKANTTVYHVVHKLVSLNTLFHCALLLPFCISPYSTSSSSSSSIPLVRILVAFCISSAYAASELRLSPQVIPEQTFIPHHCSKDLAGSNIYRGSSATILIFRFNQNVIFLSSLFYLKSGVITKAFRN